MTQLRFTFNTVYRYYVKLRLVITKAQSAIFLDVDFRNPQTLSDNDFRNPKTLTNADFVTITEIT